MPYPQGPLTLPRIDAAQDRYVMVLGRHTIVMTACAATTDWNGGEEPH
jgi:hypothetical protein